MPALLDARQPRLGAVRGAFQVLLGADDPLVAVAPGTGGRAGQGRGDAAPLEALADVGAGASVGLVRGPGGALHDVIAAAGEARTTPGAGDSGGEFTGVNQLGAGRLLGARAASPPVLPTVELEANLGAAPPGDVTFAGPPLGPAGGRVQPALPRALEVAFAVLLGEDAARVAEVGELLSLDTTGEGGWILT